MAKTGKDDVVVGCMTNYDFDAIRPWVNSLERSGFEGKKVMIVYNVAAAVVEELTKRGFIIVAFNESPDKTRYYYRDNFSIVVERFFHQWYFLRAMKEDARYLISTDVKDVIFQTNPSEALEDILEVRPDMKINAASESIRYKDEAWGRDNMQQSYGKFIYEAVSDNIIVNAGTLSGEFSTMLDFFLNVYMASVGAGTHNPDQAAVNILLRQSPYKEVTYISTPDTAWACQAGTTHDPRKIHEYMPKLTNKRDADSYLKDGMIYNSLNRPFCIVHQYDRVPEWNKALLEKYNAE